MQSRVRILALLAGSVIVVAACGGGAPATVATSAPATPVATPAATVAPTAQPATGLVVAHKAGEAHKLKPKRVEEVVEIDMGDHFFGDVLGQKNPTFTLTAGKTLGIHVHNEGAVMHELMIGQKVVMKEGEHGYERNLTELVKSDVFFYYGEVKSEIGGALYEEIEVEPGIRDLWIRITVPAELKGEWEIGCFVPDHYEKGMHAKLIFR